MKSFSGQLTYGEREDISIDGISIKMAEDRNSAVFYVEYENYGKPEIRHTYQIFKSFGKRIEKVRAAYYSR